MEIWGAEVAEYAVAASMLSGKFKMSTKVYMMFQYVDLN
jgi:hypothetical protein